MLLLEQFRGMIQVLSLNQQELLTWLLPSDDAMTLSHLLINCSVQRFDGRFRIILLQREDCQNESSIASLQAITSPLFISMFHGATYRNLWVFTDAVWIYTLECSKQLLSDHFLR